MRETRFGRRMAVLCTALVLSVGCVVTSWAATRLGKVQDTYWDEDDMTTARWDEVEDAYQYEVYLYLDDSHVTTVKTKRTHYNMQKKMTKGGEYTFKVRALPKGSSKKSQIGPWSDLSDSTYIDESFAELIKGGGVIDTNNSGPGVNSSTVAQGAAQENTSGWIKENDGRWWYRSSDGTYPVNGWWQEPGTGIWYYFDAQGYMLTGWIDWNGSRYYCLPSGAMATGDTIIDGMSYSFDTSGALLMGS